MTRYLTRLLEKTVLRDGHIRPRPETVYGPPIAGPEWQADALDPATPTAAMTSAAMMRDPSAAPRFGGDRAEAPRAADQENAGARPASAPRLLTGTSLESPTREGQRSMEGDADFAAEPSRGTTEVAPSPTAENAATRADRSLRRNGAATPPERLPRAAQLDGTGNEPEHTVESGPTPVESRTARALQSVAAMPAATSRQLPHTHAPAALIGKPAATGSELSAFGSTTATRAGGARFAQLREKATHSSAAGESPLARRSVRAASVSAAEPATVHVTIGTLEVRANPLPVQPTPKPSGAKGPRLGLDEYLRQRRDRGQV